MLREDFTIVMFYILRLETGEVVFQPSDVSGLVCKDHVDSDVATGLPEAHIK